MANDTEQTLGLLRKIKIPGEIILGSADKIIATGWSKKIQSRGTPVTVIDKAGHFFDGEQEFDLADRIETLLKTLPARNQ